MVYLKEEIISSELLSCENLCKNDILQTFDLVSESEEISVPTRILRGHNSTTYFVGIFWFESVTSP
jgi:hypothetical protein